MNQNNITNTISGERYRLIFEFLLTDTAQTGKVDTVVFIGSGVYSALQEIISVIQISGQSSCLIYEGYKLVEDSSLQPYDFKFKVNEEDRVIRYDARQPESV